MIVSEEVHVTVLKALALLGLGRERVIQVPTDRQGRMRIDFSVAFGGFKQSGVGREGGREGLLPYLEPKTLMLD